MRELIFGVEFTDVVILHYKTGLVMHRFAGVRHCGYCIGPWFIVIQQHSTTVTALAYDSFLNRLFTVALDNAIHSWSLIDGHLFHAGDFSGSCDCDCVFTDGNSQPHQATATRLWNYVFSPRFYSRYLRMAALECGTSVPVWRYLVMIYLCRVVAAW